MIALQVLGRSPTFWISLCVILSFWLWSPLFEINPQTEVLRVYGIVFAAAAGFLWLKGVARFLAKRKPVEGQQLTLGIVIVALGLAVGGIWLLIWRMAGQPPWMVNSPTNAFFLWMVVVGYVLHLMAPRVGDHEIPWPSHVVLWFSFLLATGLSLLLIYSRPDLRPLADWLKQYMA